MPYILESIGERLKDRNLHIRSGNNMDKNRKQCLESEKEIWRANHDFTFQVRAFFDMVFSAPNREYRPVRSKIGTF